ncbi:MAG TPA: DUF3592 domain-containing protein [Blastocatellia bacterium]|nr:DUF3592 domain-containing protein [Blastocatellia bacterium]
MSRSKAEIPLTPALRIIGGLLAIWSIWMLSAPTLDLLKNFYWGVVSSSWPSTVGQITSAKIKHTTYKGRPTVNTDADIQYTYAINGRYLTGERKEFLSDGRGFGRHTGYDFLEKYPVGTDTSVYYDPSDPTLSVLEPGLEFSRVMGGIFVLLALGIAWVMMAWVLVIAVRPEKVKKPRRYTKRKKAKRNRPMLRKIPLVRI